MELGFYDLFTNYEMEVETHVHVQIENQLGFHELFRFIYMKQINRVEHGSQVEVHMHA